MVGRWRIEGQRLYFARDQIFEKYRAIRRHSCGDDKYRIGIIKWT